MFTPSIVAAHLSALCLYEPVRCTR